MLLEKEIPTFPPRDDFAREIERRVQLYFSLNNISENGNIALYLKTGILFSVFWALYYVFVFTPLSWWPAFLVCVGLGIAVASIGFNVMHDGAHGSYSSKKWVNEIMGHSLNFLGANVYLWKFKHNVLHHTFTNVKDHDEDINVGPFMRLHPDQPRKWFHKYQHIYWVVLYPWIYFVWVYINDFVKYFSGEIEGRRFKKMNGLQHFIFWFSKAVHVGFFIILPLCFMPFLEWCIGFLIIMLTCGLTISIVFQLAHVVPKANFPKEGEDLQAWHHHQKDATVNFATGSRLIRWFSGGLNFQIEHHLFPRISHVHYPNIRILVKKLCVEKNIAYYEYSTMLDAIIAHIVYLRYMGKA